MARRRALGNRRATTALAAVLVLAGCSTSGQVGPPATSAAASAAETVPFAGCDSVACVGTIDGAPYEIAMPKTWNGTLLLYSHGYRNPTNSTPRNPVPAPGWDSGNKQIGQQLLDQGYAIAGSAYQSDGWAVSDGVTAAEALYGFFANKIAKPQRVYAWGDSLGGLVTQVLSERHPAWLSGTAPLCGVLAGVVPNMDLALDVAYAVKSLIYPKLKLTGFSSLAEAQSELKLATEAVFKAGLETDPGTIAYVAAVGDAPPKTRDQPGDSDSSKLLAYGEGIIFALTFSTVGRYDLEQRFGGNISGNTATSYASRIDPSEAAFIAKQGGSVAAFNNMLAADSRVKADPSAVAAAVAGGGDPTGDTTVPTITLHTQYDQVVIVQNESYYRSRYQSKPRTGGLTQFYTSPPAQYPPSGAPYGAGHCNFSTGSRVGIINLLDQWVRSGQPPTAQQATIAFGPDSGLNPGFQPRNWLAQR